MTINHLCKKSLSLLAALLLLWSYARAQSSTTYSLWPSTSPAYTDTLPNKALLHPGCTSAVPSRWPTYSPPRIFSHSRGLSIRFLFNIPRAVNDLTAQFGVTETKDVLPCIFDNFVWFTDVDLDRALRQHVTFYDGESPVRGNSVGEIRSALQDLLRANGISGEVGELPYGTSGKVGALLFHVDGIPQSIKNIAFSGEAAISDKQLMMASAGLANQDFSITNVAAYARLRCYLCITSAGTCARSLAAQR